MTECVTTVTYFASTGIALWNEKIEGRVFQSRRDIEKFWGWLKETIHSSDPKVGINPPPRDQIGGAKDPFRWAPGGYSGKKEKRRKYLFHY